MTPNRLHQMRIAVGVSSGGRSIANLIEKQSNLSYEVGAVFSSSPNIGASVHFVSARYDKGKIIAEGTTDDLKAQVGGDRITIRIREFAERSEAEQAQKILQQLPIVQSITINAAQGNSVNLFVTPDPNAINEIQNMLAAVDINVFSLAQSRPSLDDVFLAATGQTILDAEISQSEMMTAPKKRKPK